MGLTAADEYREDGPVLYLIIPLPLDFPMPTERLARLYTFNDYVGWNRRYVPPNHKLVSKHISWG